MGEAKARYRQIQGDRYIEEKQAATPETGGYNRSVKQRGNRRILPVSPGKLLEEIHHGFH